MNKLVLFILSLTLWASAYADCPKFTKEQKTLLTYSYLVGNQHNPKLESKINTRVGYTLSAIVWKESFIGDKVFRYHPNDPAYGVTAITFPAYLETIKVRDMSYDTIHKHSYIIEKLLTNDLEAIKISYKYLTSRILLNNSLWLGVKAYNGSGAMAQSYSEDIKLKVKTLIKCKTKVGVYE